MQFFLGSQNGPELLGMPDCEILELPSVNWTIHANQEKGQNNEQSKQN